MTTRQFYPPKFGVGQAYKAWRNRLKMWILITETPKRKRGILVLLESLQGNMKAEKVAEDIAAEDLDNENGLDILLEKLDQVFKSESVDEAYDAYVKFVNYKKQQVDSMLDYILEFEHRHNKLVEHDMKLPDTILAFKLLDGADLNGDQRHMVLTIAHDLKFTSMKSALKRIFSKHDMEEEETSPIIKKENAYTAKIDFPRTSRSYGNTSALGQQYFGRSKNNPLDKQGKITRCRICDSMMHWANKCPHRDNIRYTNICQDENLDDLHEGSSEDLIYISFDTEYENVLISDVANCGIIDTACSKTVAGRGWYDEYISLLDDKEASKVQTSASSKVFRFGDGNQLQSQMKAIIPIQIAEKKCKLEVEIVEGNLPLLVSKQTMKNMGVVLDLLNDSILILEEKMPLNTTSNGHYALEVLPRPNPTVGHEQILAIDKEKDFEEKDLVKIHKQFGHASVENMKKLLKTANKDNSGMTSMIESTVENCDTCKLYKKPPSRPIVSLPNSDNFNETVSVDLHQIDKGVWFLHMIDEFTRYSNAVIIHNKLPATIIQQFMKNWISIYGAPSRILSDNGGEFDCEEFKQMCENFNIKYITTPAYSPWSNGVCERHIRVLNEIFLKVCEDSTKANRKCSLETALAWAVSAKNALINTYGYSPNQLVFGRSAGLPSVIEDKLPALEGSTTSMTIANNIIALHMARKAFMEVETSEKIRRALRKQTRQSRDNFEHGDEVYYKRENHLKWKGPGKVIGQDGAVVFVRHGGQCIKAHSCRVIPTENKALVDNIDAKIQNCDATQQDKLDLPVVARPVDNKNLDAEKNEPMEAGRSEYDETDLQSEKKSLAQTSDLSTKSALDSIRSFSKGNTVKYLLDGQDYEARIISRAGKATGKYKHAYNVEFIYPLHLQGKQAYVDFDKVEDIARIGNEGVEVEEMHVVNDMDFNSAKEAELQSWKDNAVYAEVPNEGQCAISVRWVCNIKDGETGLVPKARLVARGFELQDQTIEKESPTCSKDSLRVVLAIAAQKRWNLNTVDIKTAFLQGNVMESDIYLKPPKEAKTSNLWKLKKCVYGLPDASLKWYETLKQFLCKNNAKMCSTDPAVFYYYHAGILQGVLAIHVDDILWAGTRHFEDTLVKSLRSTFRIGKEENEAFKYLGLHVSQTKSRISLNQKIYIENMKMIPLLGNNDAKCLGEKEKDTLRSRIGQLLWASSQTRPDISFDACQLATRLKEAKFSDLRYANKIVRKLKANTVDLNFESLGPDEVLKLVVFADAAHANLQDGGSQGGHLIFMVGENNKCSLLNWQSKKLRRVAKSTLVAETLALSEAMDSAVLVNTIFSEIYFGNERNLPIEIITDNKSIYDTLRSKKNVSDKRLRVEVAALREMMQQGVLRKIDWVQSDKQLANTLTKQGASSKQLQEVLALVKLEQ